MRQTNKYMQGGTVMIIAAGLGLSSTAFSKDSSEPIIDAAQTILDKAGRPTLPELEVTPNPSPETETQTAPIAPKKFAEAPEETTSVHPAAHSSAVTNLSPMRLRFHPRFTTEQLEKIDKQRFAYAATNEDKLLKAALDDTFKKMSYKNRFELTIDDIGIGHLKISLGQGGWPGYPAQNTGWLKRDLSVDMQRGLKDIIKRCSLEPGPVFFNADITEGDADIGKGTFEVSCVAGTKNVYENLSDKDLANAYLNSSDLPLQKRQDNFQWMNRFAMMYDYVKSNPGATIADDRIACIRINTEQKEKHTFSNRHRKMADHFLENCYKVDYNYIRKRFNLPNAQ